VKVFIDKKNTESIAISRTVEALIKYAPAKIDFVTDPHLADLVIFNVVGRLSQTTQRIISYGKPYAIIQYTFRSTLNPHIKDWLPLWKKAKLVWSYYKLDSSKNFNLYHSPLGVDKVFKRYPTDKKYIIATSGIGYLQESVRECILAAQALGYKVFHVGPVVTNRQNVDFSNGMSDLNLAKNYSACEFVAGLRRTEGFELPVIEGLVCGARPIVFDAPHYRHWFKDFAIFIPEGSRDEVTTSLIEIFKKSPRPVRNAEISEARRRFDWEKIIKGFWTRI
jgi:hypothetical protein